MSDNMTTSRKPSTVSNAPLISKVVAVEENELEMILAEMGISESNKEVARRVLGQGLKQSDVAAERGVSRELVSSVVRRVRARLTNSISPWTLVTVPLTLPLGLAEQMRALSQNIAQMKNHEDVEVILKDVMKALAVANVKALYGA